MYDLPQRLGPQTHARTRLASARLTTHKGVATQTLRARKGVLAMRLIFVGSGEFGVPTLATLYDTHDVVAVVTQPDRPAGRHRRLTPTAIGQWAKDHDLPVHKVDDVNAPDVIQTLRDYKADAGVIIAFGQKLSPAVVDALGEVAMNLHASLLPAYRGAAPINWAIMHGEDETGVSVISIDQKMDAGVIYHQARTEIREFDTAGELHDRLAMMGPEAIEAVLKQVRAGTLKGTPQDENHVTHAPKLSKQDGWITFNATAQRVRQQVHGLNPWPTARVGWLDDEHETLHELIVLRCQDHSDYTHDARHGILLDDYRVATRDGVLELLEVQAPGGKPMSIEQFINGHPLDAGDQLISLKDLPQTGNVSKPR